MHLTALSFAALAATVAGVRVNTTDVSSPCTFTSNRASCTYKSQTIQGRSVRYTVPIGTAPSGGWPVVLLFHGWNMGGAAAWAGSPNDVMYNKVVVKSALLAAGYAVVCPDSNTYQAGGYWETNVAPYSTGTMNIWQQSTDHMFLMSLLENIRQNSDWGMNVADGLHILGFSSGGYQASRMAMNAVDFRVGDFTYRFKSVNIMSGGPAWCSGSTCSSTKFSESLVVAAMKAHPPTLFCHGNVDYTVPIGFAQDYQSRLNAMGIRTSFYTGNGLGHYWLPGVSTNILAWINKYN